MGRFEDLIAQVKEGDEAALDALETEFSGSTLREKAERADILEAELQKAKPFQRRARFDDLTAKLDEGLRDLLTFEDVGDVEPESLTLEGLQDLATSKKQAREATRLAVAKDAGFDSVEEYETALEAVKNQQNQRREGMEAVGGAAASSGGDPAGSQEPDQFTTGKAAFDEAKKAGATDDVAQAAFIDSILSVQSQGAEES